jgi:hypothetical protein
VNMRIVIAGVLIAIVGIGTTDILPPSVKNNIRSAVMPGYQTNDIDALHPQLRVKIDRIIARLESKQFRPRLHATYRSQDYQDFIYNLSVFKKRFTGRKGLTTTNKSCHSKELKGGKAGARAVDMRQGVSGPHLHLPVSQFRAKHAAFYQALGSEAKKEGLRWGGDFKGNSMWAEFGMGWDPGHVSWRC